MKKKTLIYLPLGFFAWIFIVSGIFKWLGVSSFDKLFTDIFGKPNFLNNIMIIFFSGIIVASLIWIINKINKITT